MRPLLPSELAVGSSSVVTAIDGSTVELTLEDGVQCLTADGVLAPNEVQIPQGGDFFCL